MNVTQTAAGNSTSVLWGAPLTWGTALTLTAQVIGSFDGSPTLDVGVVQDLGLGLYKVSYTASRGKSVKVFVLLNGQEIPGAPFSVSLLPSAVPQARFSASSGSGLSGVVRGQRALFVLSTADLYGNTLRASGFAANISVTARSAAADTAAAVSGVVSGRAVPFSVQDNGDGTYTVSYSIPTDMKNSRFLLDVTLNGVPVLSSPFTGTNTHSHTSLTSLHSLHTLHTAFD